MNEPDREYNGTPPAIIREEWYKTYEKGVDRNNLLRNPGVLLQNVAQEVAYPGAARGQCRSADGAGPGRRLRRGHRHDDISAGWF